MYFIKCYFIDSSIHSVTETGNRGKFRKVATSASYEISLRF